MSKIIPEENHVTLVLIFQHNERRALIFVSVRLKEIVGPFCRVVRCGVMGRAVEIKIPPMGALTRLFMSSHQGDSLCTISFMALSYSS